MQPFNDGGGSGSNRAEAERWLVIAEKLLSGRDLIGTKTFAIRARESDPRVDGSELIIAVADTLIAGQKMINNQPEWYGILQLPPLCRDMELIASKYRQLALLLNPHKNRLPYADEAIALVSYSWSVLSDPSKKFLYDNDLNLFMRFDSASGRTQPFDLQFVQNQNQIQQPPPQFPPEQPLSQPLQPLQQHGNEPSVRSMNEEESEREDSGDEDSPFWTACPYCYYMYEYPGIFKDCTFRCHNCQRAFHGVKIASPPITVNGNDTHYCCWGFVPLAGSMSTSNNKNWTPFSQMISFRPDVVNKAPLKRHSVPRVHSDDDDDEEEDDESNGSDADWGTNTGSMKKKVKYATKGKTQKNDNHHGKTETGGRELQSSAVIAETSKSKSNPKNNHGIVPKEWGRLDLNVELSNDAEEQITSGMKLGGRVKTVQAEEKEEVDDEEEEGIEGISFFEGLDEFLNSLPILNAVGDDKVRAA